MAKTGRDSVQQMLRLPEGMRERIRAAAEANNRSVNAEIVATLEEKYPAAQPFVIINVDEAVEMVRKRVDEEGNESPANTLLAYLEEAKRRQDAYVEKHGRLPTENAYRFGKQDPEE